MTKVQQLHQLTKVETEMAEMMAEAVTATEIKEGLESRLFCFSTV
jgi:DNA-binding CsgD family transcriptional regulator